MTKTKLSRLGQIALQYAGDHSVIPLQRNKKPLVAWKAYQLIRAGEDQIRQWWDKYPNANVGIVCGSISGVFAVDADSPEALAELIKRGLTPTRTVKSRRGWHFWYRHPGFKVRNIRPFDNCDIRGDGGIIPAPGSIHFTGYEYTLIRDLPIAEAPAWLLEELRPKPREIAPYSPINIGTDDRLVRAYVEASIAKELSILERTQTGRNLQLFRSASALGSLVGAGVLTEAQAQAELERAATANGYMQKDGHNAALSTIRSGLQAGKEQPRDLSRIGENYIPAKLAIMPINKAVEPEPQPQASGLPNGIRAAGLVCKLDRVIICLELLGKAIEAGNIPPEAPIDPQALIDAAKSLGLEVSESVIRNGLKDGAKLAIFEKSENRSLSIQDIGNTEKSIITGFVATLTGRVVYKAQPLPEITRILRKLLPSQLLELIYPINRGGRILPDPDMPYRGGKLADELLEGIDMSPDEYAAFAQVARDQDALEAKRLVGLYRKALYILNMALNSPVSTPLPAGAPWGSGPEYAASFLRAIHEADPKPRSRFEISLITGRRPNNVGATIKRAGLENVRQQAEVIPVQPDKIKVEACQAAKDKGVIVGIISIDQNDQPIDAIPLESPNLTAWAEQQAAQGYRLGAKIQPKAKQRIVGDVQKIERRTIAPEPQAQPVERQPKQPRDLPGVKLSSSWREAYFAEIAQRKADKAIITRPQAQAISIVVEPQKHGDITPRANWQEDLTNHFDDMDRLDKALLDAYGLNRYTGSEELLQAWKAAEYNRESDYFWRVITRQSRLGGIDRRVYRLVGAKIELIQSRRNQTEKPLQAVQALYGA